MGKVKNYLLSLTALLCLSSCVEPVQSGKFDVSGSVLLCECANDTVTLTLESKEYGRAEVVSDTDGNYVFPDVWNGTYTITPKKEGYTFYPSSREVTVSNGKVEFADFDTISSWQKTFGDGMKDAEAYSVYQTPDCGFIIAGYRDVSGTETENLDMWIIKTDLYGNILWETTYGEDYYPDIAYGAIEDNAGNIVVSGYSDSLDAGAISMLKYIPDSEVWTLTGGFQTTYGTVDLPEKPAYILETLDSGYFSGGFSGGTAGNLEDVYGVKADTSGVVVRELAYGTDDSERSNAADMIIRDESYEGGFILAGETEESSGETSAILLKRNSNLDEVWNKKIAAIDPSTSLDCYYTSINSVKEADDTGYICSGTIKKESFSTRDIYILKTDSEGNEEWNRILDFGSDDYNGIVTITSDGGFAVGLTYLSIITGNYCIRLVKFNSSGEIQWQRSFESDEDNDLYIKSLVQTYDGGYSICGIKTIYNGKSQVYIAKTDVNGDLP